MNAKEFIYKDRHENTLFDLMIWWGGLLIDPDAPKEPISEFICDFPSEVDQLLPYSLESHTQGLPRTDDCNIPVIFNDYRRGTKTELEPGDRIVFDGDSTLTLYRFYSICSRHQVTDADCAICEKGAYVRV